MYNEIVYHLDLCILSYHLYGQTLIWPMDPYYEQMSRKGTSRRILFMGRVVHGEYDKKDHDFRLDPIRFNYDQINPWRPCFVKPENIWEVFNAPKVITDSIKTVYMEQMKSKKINNPSADVGDQTDDLYCFEGETGIIPATGTKKEKKGAKSFMGFVLARQINDDKEYDVHIVFRGSRSGSAERALYEGKFDEKGNPDWITDTDFGILMASEVSGIGKACRGFQASVQQTKGNITNCLKQIQADRKKPPRHIYVTGHSLGGALATHYASLLQKVEGKSIEELKQWPLNDIKVYTYGAPVTGDKQFCEYFGINIPTVRVLIDGDWITQEKFNLQGRPVRSAQTHAGTVLRLPPVDDKIGRFERHEPSFIRRSLISWLKAKNVNITDVPANTGSISKRNEEPWVICKSMIDVLKHPALKDTNARYIKEHLPFFNNNGNTEGYLHRYMMYFFHTLDDTSAYKNPFTSFDTKVKKQQAIKDVIVYADEEMSLDTLQVKLKEAETLMNDEHSLRLLTMCAILRRLINFPGDAKELIEGKKYPVLTDCIKKI